ncbi:MAG: biotin--[acetyl-CoA-carboxylase] ligase [Chloracidobacterium sp.]|nr:biotin--[acetyl-CoA-carboxylase] ligase [Chloracidobacterium sp.]
MNFTILRYESLGSTNSEAAEHAHRGADEGLCIIAERQTAGRGRHGRTWVSEAGSGLYFSVVLRPKLPPASIPLITLMTGVAVFDTLLEFGIKPDIKWVNDILVNDLKISGILAETVETGLGLAVVVGIGINLTSRNFPDEIAGSATSVEEIAGKRILPDEMAEALTRYLRYFYDILASQSGPGEIISQWRRRSTYYSGKPVRVICSNETVEGETAGLEENGALRVKTSDGSVRIIQSGDVTRLRAADQRP